MTEFRHFHKSNSLVWFSAHANSRYAITPPFLSHCMSIARSLRWQNHRRCVFIARSIIKPIVSVAAILKDCISRSVDVDADHREVFLFRYWFKFVAVFRFRNFSYHQFNDTNYKIYIECVFFLYLSLPLWRRQLNGEGGRREIDNQESIMHSWLIQSKSNGVGFARAPNVLNDFSGLTYVA